MHKFILCFTGKFAAERMPSSANEVAMWVSSRPGKVLVLLDADTGVRLGQGPQLGFGNKMDAGIAS